RRLGDLKAEHQQLAMDPRCSPLWIFPAHSSDEIVQLSIDLWSPCPLPRFPPHPGRARLCIQMASSGTPYSETPSVQPRSKVRSRCPFENPFQATILLPNPLPVGPVGPSLRTQGHASPRAPT